MQKKMNNYELVQTYPYVVEKYGPAVSKGYLQYYNEKDWKYTLVGAWLTKKGTTLTVLDTLKEASGGRYPTYAILSEATLQRFVELLANKVSISTYTTYVSMFKTVLRERMTKYTIPCPEFRIMAILSYRPGKMAARQSVYLTMEEVERINRYVPENDEEAYVKKCFLIGCYTGARISDAVTLDETNIIDGDLVFSTKKTHTEIQMDVHDNVMKYIKMDTPLPMPMTRFKYNYVLKNICRKCGIIDEVTIVHRSKKTTAPKYKFVSSHTARRTFATNLYLSDVQTDEIAMYMGHADISTTRNYIRCRPKRSAAAAAFFHKDII